MAKKLVLVVGVLVILLVLALPASASAAPLKMGDGFYYLVRRGDTLASIAHRFGVSVGEIASINGISNINRIYAGTYLWIPQQPAPPCNSGCRVVYRVRCGDTLAQIAARFGVSVRRLAEANNIWNWDRIFVGQRLCIP